MGITGLKDQVRHARRVQILYGHDASGELPGLRQQHTSTSMRYLQQATLLAVSRRLGPHKKTVTSRNPATSLYSAHHHRFILIKPGHSKTCAGLRGSSKVMRFIVEYSEEKEVGRTA